LQISFEAIDPQEENAVFAVSLLDLVCFLYHGLDVGGVVGVFLGGEDGVGFYHFLRV
jgi:hypothetical protein